MSWDADLSCEHCGTTVASWNYTHNTNGMADNVLGNGRSWWRELHGKSATAGAALLDQIISGMEADPDKYRAMNPDNGWGTYDRFLAMLREMLDRSDGRSGMRWEVYG